ncbi:MAG: chemotaxis protein CheW [Desulfobulbaceae bacterium]|nr:chemotaxis protein CheW [Desulfobulbaceae bacterium]
MSPSSQTPNPGSKIRDPKSMEGEYACLAISNEEYGIKTLQINSIMGRPVIRTVPKAPDFVEGVANIHGRIVPVLNPAERFGLLNFDSGSKDQSSRNNKQSKLLLVEQDKILYGLLVDQFLSLDYLTEAMIEPVNPLMVKKEAAFIRGMAKHGERVIHLLDLGSFINAGIEADAEDISAYQAVMEDRINSLKQRVTEKYHRFLSFQIGTESYGMDISRLVTIMRAEHMKKAKKGPKYLAGIVQTAGTLFPVIDMQKKLSLEESPYTDEARISIIDSGTICYGILTNAVNDIVNLSDNDIKEAPAIIAGNDAAHIKAVGMLDEDQRLLILLDETKVLSKKEESLLKNMEELKKSVQKHGPRVKREETRDVLVLFKVAGMDFAVPAGDVSEVIHYTVPHKVPKAPDFVRGIIPVRGELVSVIDIRKRFDLAEEKDASEDRILIVKQDSVLYGVIADSVTEIIGVSSKDVMAPPEIVKGIDGKFLQGILKITDSDRTPIVLNMKEMLKEI